MKMSQTNEVKRKELRLEVKTYLDRLKYALENGSATINYQEERRVDQKRNKRYTNRFTVSQLFPDDDEIEALKRELSHLTVEEYIETVKDTRFPKRSEMRVFGKQYSGDDVYIKIRVELVSTLANGANYVFVMSFHYSEWDFKKSDFPYKKV
ncbi:MAG TPA: hypothetical protein DCG38_04015 [Eubacteriaceae bacterium]|nr:hypothetical protein [Eubacteriaceae bacterium]